MATNDFKPFAVGAGANVIDQADYEALAELSSGFTAGKASSEQVNKVLRQSSSIAAVLAQYIANSSGSDVLDNGDTATILANLLLAIQLTTKASVVPILSGVTGETRNARMSVLAASTTATFAADEIIVSSAIGGSQYRIGSFSKTMSLTTTGAGGMDTGTVPATGFVALYAIYNPASGGSALLAVNATSAVATEVYTGANMPIGYTASSLVSVWPISSSQFMIGNQYERKIDIASSAILTSNTVNASRTTLSTNAFPLNAKFIYGGLSINNSSAATQGLTIWGANGSVGGMAITATLIAGGSASSTFSKISVTGQHIGWTSSSTAGTPTFGIGICAYEF